MLTTKFAPKTFTRLRDLAVLPKLLRSLDLSFFVETADGLALGKGVPIRYAICELATLVNEPLAYRNKILMNRLTAGEAQLLGANGFTAIQKGGLKLWQKS